MNHSLRNIYLIISIFVIWALWAIYPAYAGDYLDSAHGDTNYGVNRKGMEVGTGRGYVKGNCAHCHEQHANDLAGGPYNYSLFYDNYKSIDPPPPDGLCFKCHDGTSTTQVNAILNYSYSYRAGNWTAGGSPDNIADFFDSTLYSPQVNYFHDLDDIRDFIDNDAFGWGYTDKSNPCVACHDPHTTQGDPENSTSAKSSGSRGWPLSRPSQHNSSPWSLWGDDYTNPGSGGGERLNNYSLKYQAPYRFGVQPAAGYEPDGSTSIYDGSNLTDFVSFCTDCHNDTNSITSTPLIRPLFTIDWTTEKHGGSSATGSLCGDAPYGTTLDRVLSCLDCHESHGSPNAYILRQEVNGSALSTTLEPGKPGAVVVGSPTTTWSTLCNSCHLDDSEIDITNCTTYTGTWFIVHHDQTSPAACSADAPYPDLTGSCNLSGCHATDSTGSKDCNDSTVGKLSCDACHYHGSTDAAAPLSYRTNEKTF
jgi:predicted CXXCH cytochrome family protein